MHQDSQKYGVEAGIVVRQLGMQHDGQEYSTEARIAVGR